MSISLKLSSSHIISTMCSISSTKPTLCAQIWCLIYSNVVVVVGILSTIVILIHPPAAPPMPERKRASSHRLRPSPSKTSIDTKSSTESTTSTLVEGFTSSTSFAQSTEDTALLQAKQARRPSISFMHTTVVLPTSKDFTRPMKPIARRIASSSHIVSHTLKDNIVTPTSKMTAQILPASKASSQKTAKKVAFLTRQSYKATKKFVGKM
ncbi:hypothetical protein F5876DRAFT_72479 [Lentinula aff. lateritia]|uniref:Uncharacterized protein n=1 Tax=Lentinula aff. lateritia TaxID=2804960 RepID=A0ACC1UE05_9AGAR|nr:hypothetical protein F5876DRAFT_72479 [Lentinula aff. lateritia]